MRLTILLFCLAISTASYADLVEISLPDLTGDFDSGFLPPNDAPRVRACTFTIPPEVLSVDQLQLVMSGTNSDGWMICEYDVGGGQTILDTLSVPTQMRLILTAETLGGDCFFGIVNLLTPTFTDESGPVGNCDVGNPLDPSLLLNTTIQAELECNFTPSCDAWIDALTSLTDVRLVLDGQLVAAETRSWGSVKALFR